ncbi:MAG: hypothetical protein LBV21_05815 [Candidatus Adiutrix sp.]|jgi:hypothetical protein|nr:hypothetical protein [Candidatus Adiutrix sp.]
MKANPADPAAYLESCRAIAERHFAGLGLAEVAALEADFNAYPGLDRLEPPRNLLILEDQMASGRVAAAQKAVLDGRIFWEHTAAGEGVRLGLGPKYLLDSSRLPDLPSNSPRPRPWTLGDRHLGQWAFEMRNLAEAAELEPRAVLARQTILLIVSAEGRAGITGRILASNFLGLKPENFLFMEQTAFPALRPEGGWHFEAGTARRLHNHGHMVMQKTMPGQVFHLDRAGRETRLSRAEFFGRLERADDLVSHSIEDLGYLTAALDFAAIGLALALGERGFGLVMEIVPNNPDRPVKGGLCAHDPAPGRDVMVESLRLRGLPPERLNHLNKNFNHYPHPAGIFSRLAEEGLFMPVTVKEEGLYFQPVLGDLNFLAPTAFFTRRRPTPLSSWKSPADTPAALAALARQDAQPGFAEFMTAGS